MVEGAVARSYRGETDAQTLQEAYNATQSVGAGIPTGEEHDPGPGYSNEEIGRAIDAFEEIMGEDERVLEP